MPLTKLDHFLILADDLDATRDFYVDVLGLSQGERPAFPFPGFWLYVDGVACVHIAQSADRASPDQADYLESVARTEGTGALDHVAFVATDLKGMVAGLEARGIALRRRTVPEQGLHQVFLKDPNGITIELNFAAGEAA